MACLTSDWASLSGHQALDIIQGVSGTEHIVKKNHFWIPQMEIKMIMSLTYEVPIFLHYCYF